MSQQKKHINWEQQEGSANKWLVLASVMIGTFMAVLDATIVNVAFPKLMAVFGVSIDQIEWVATGYMLAFAVVLPASGWIADRFGYKKTYIFGIALFTLGSLLSSLSWNESILITFRIVQGMGGGFIMPVGMAIVTRAFPPNQRGVALGFWGIAAAASVSLGPLFGGYLVDNYSWHAIFDINVPVGIFGIIAVAIIQNEYKSEVRTKFDLGGIVTMVIGLGSLLLALSTGNSSWNTKGWHSEFIIVNFLIAGISLTLFVVIELTSKHPLLNLRLLRFHNFWISTVMLFIFGVAFFGNAFLLPLYLQNSLGYTAYQAGLVFLPVGILQAIMSPIAGQLTDRFNPKIPILLGSLVLGVSMYLFTTLSLQTMHSEIMFPLYLRGLGIGLVFIPLSAVALFDIPKTQLAQASGLMNTIRQIGGSFGIALLGTLLTQRITFHAQTYGEQVHQNSPVFQQTLANLKVFAMHALGSNNIDAMSQAKSLLLGNLTGQAYVQGINDDFMIGAILTFGMIIPLLFLRTNKKHLNR
ncbi:MAG: DHA2 family efflux MFS transporter permease subunit [Bacteroidales bacterium]|nr:DHA2 family efflux MFS transporter permease subunit [Bacteroidales bacterium]